MSGWREGRILRAFEAPPRPGRAGPVGRGGARERAQFSPQAETELSGLCDDDNGGRIPRGNGPRGQQVPIISIERNLT